MGVYELGTPSGTVVYIGRTGNLRERILGGHRHAGRFSCIGREATQFRYEQTHGAMARERALFEEYQQTHGGTLPRCNEENP